MLYYNRINSFHQSCESSTQHTPNMKNLMTNFRTRVPLMVFVAIFLSGIVYTTVPKVIKYLFLYEQRGEMHTLLIPMILFVYASITGVIMTTTRAFLSRPLKSWNELGLVSTLYRLMFFPMVIGVTIGNILGYYFRGFTCSDFLWGFAINAIFIYPLSGLIVGLLLELRKTRSVKQ